MQRLLPLAGHTKPHQPLSAGAAGAPGATPAAAAVHVELEVNRVAGALASPERRRETIAWGKTPPLSAPVQKWQYWLNVCRAARDKVASHLPEIVSKGERERVGASERASVRAHACVHGQVSGGRQRASLCPYPQL